MFCVLIFPFNLTFFPLLMNICLCFVCFLSSLLNIRHVYFFLVIKQTSFCSNDNDNNNNNNNNNNIMINNRIILV